MKKIIFSIHFVTIFIPLCFIFLFFVQSGKLSFIQDDTFISLRYAQNFAEGNGLVFNPNEKTEGFTSFLWVIVLSAANKLNLNPEQFCTASSTLFGVLVIILTYLLCNLFLQKKYKPDLNKSIPPYNDFIPLLIFPLFSFNTAYVYWSVSGMEETFFMFLFLTSLYFFIKRIEQNRFHYTFILFGILTCLTRPEGILLVSVLILIKLILLKNSKQSILNKLLLLELLAFSVLIFGFILFRLLYYGYLMPNTFYAKSGFTIFHLKRGFEYLFSFLKTNMLFGILFIFPLFTAVIRKDKALLLIILSSIFFCLLIALIGGDVLPLHRLFFPVLPLIYLAIILSFISILQMRPYNKTLVLLFLVITAAACFNSYSNEADTAFEKRSFETGLVSKMKIYADWVKQKQMETGRITTAALSTIGAFSYYSGANVIDLAGLTDKYTAHYPKETPGITDSLPVLWKERTYNAEYVLNRAPDYIIFPAGAKPSAFPECALFVQKEFFNKYYLQLIFSEKLNEYLPVFTKRNGSGNKFFSSECDNSFVANYINASNLFLLLNGTNGNELLPKIELEIKEMILKCPDRKGEALALLGFAKYHIKQFAEAEVLLNESLLNDSLNSASLLYLRNIALIKKDTTSAIKFMIRLKQISPEALPNLRY